MKWKGYDNAWNEWYGTDLLGEADQLVEDYERQHNGRSTRKQRRCPAIEPSPSTMEATPGAIEAPPSATEAPPNASGQVPSYTHPTRTVLRNPMGLIPVPQRSPPRSSPQSPPGRNPSRCVRFA